jgi:hypothetical protein
MLSGTDYPKAKRHRIRFGLALKLTSTRAAQARQCNRATKPLHALME